MASCGSGTSPPFPPAGVGTALAPGGLIPRPLRPPRCLSVFVQVDEIPRAASSGLNDPSSLAFPRGRDAFLSVILVALCCLLSRMFMSFFHTEEPRTQHSPTGESHRKNPRDKQLSH